MLSNPPGRLGAVIAGGRASRFGGDKAAALLAGKPLIEHAAAVLAPWVGAIVVCGREWPGFAMLADRPSAGLGPLGGIAAALRRAADHGWAQVLTIACDMPVVPDTLLAAIAGGGSRYCSDAPILGCWDAALADRLDAHLAGGGDRSIRRWAASIGAAAVPAPGPLANINTRGDLLDLPVTGSGGGT